MLNEFTLVFLFLPIATLLLSMIARLFIKRRSLIVGGAFLIYVILASTLFNSSFLIWAIIYSVIALLATLIADRIKKVLLKKLLKKYGISDWNWM